MSHEHRQMLKFTSRSKFNETQSDSTLKQVQIHFWPLNRRGGFEVRKTRVAQDQSRQELGPVSHVIWLT